jgi:hypothetical protein
MKNIRPFQKDNEISHHAIKVTSFPFYFEIVNSLTGRKEKIKLFFEIHRNIT